MTNRTFFQYGCGYGDEDVVATVTIDGIQVFSGAVYTQNTDLPPPPYGNIVYPLFDWQKDVMENVGTGTMSIAVTGGNLLLTSAAANYDLNSVPQNPDKKEMVAQSELTSGPMYDEPVNGVIIFESKTDVKINGVLQPKDPVTPGDANGEWCYIIPNGSTLECNIRWDFPGIKPEWLLP